MVMVRVEFVHDLGEISAEILTEIWPLMCQIIISFFFSFYSKMGAKSGPSIGSLLKLGWTNLWASNTHKNGLEKWVGLNL